MLDIFQKRTKVLDKNQVLDSIKLLGAQCQQAWEEAAQVKVGLNFSKCRQVLIVGMGGSALAAQVVKAVAPMKVPLIVNNDYQLPSWVDKQTLIILVSYSGNTEEVIEASKEACLKTNKILGITSGGKLATFFKTKKIPFYHLKADHNPCNQPRLALGYQLIGLLVLLQKSKLLTLNNQIKKINDTIKKSGQKVEMAVPTTKNIAKKIALAIKGKIPVILASEHLAGNAHILANQINENAKNFALWFLIPEINHHLLEGFLYPKKNSKNLLVISLESNLYYDRNKFRYQISREILNRQQIPICRLKLTAPTTDLQIWEALQIGNYLAYYLAMLNNQDPADIVYVKYLKKRLSK